MREEQNFKVGQRIYLTKLFGKKSQTTATGVFYYAKKLDRKTYNIISY